MLDINKLIMVAMKEKNQTEVQVLRAIKTEFTKYETAKSGNVITEAVEANILNKMKSQREDSIAQYTAANRLDLVEAETAELEVVKKYAPKEVSTEDITILITKWVSENNSNGLSMKDMRLVSEVVKAVYPSANGKVIADVFKSMI